MKFHCKTLHASVVFGPSALYWCSEVHDARASSGQGLLYCIALHIFSVQNLKVHCTDELKCRTRVQVADRGYLPQLLAWFLLFPSFPHPPSLNFLFSILSLPIILFCFSSKTLNYVFPVDEDKNRRWWCRHCLYVQIVGGNGQNLFMIAMTMTMMMTVMTNPDDDEDLKQ